MLKLSSAQIEQFKDQGYVYLPNAIDSKKIKPVRSRILKELEQQKIWARGKVLSSQLKNFPAFQQVSHLGKMIKYPALRDELIDDDLYVGIRRLSDASLTQDQDAMLLISLPHQGEWTLLGLDWHRDISESSAGKIPGVQAFILLDNLVPHGGATMALAGSHKLRGQSRSKQNVEKLLRENPHSMLLADGINLSVLEMSGSPGDVYLMDMRLLHTPSINASSNVRLMATIRFFVR